MRAEVRLAKTELKSEAREVLRTVPLFAGSAILGLYALAFLLTAGLLALTLVIPPWAAALVIFVVTAIAGGIAFTIAKARWRALQLTPEKTVQTLKENAEWLKTQTR